MFTVDRVNNDERVRIAECEDIQDAIAEMEKDMAVYGEGCVYELVRVDDGEG